MKQIICLATVIGAIATANGGEIIKRWTFGTNSLPPSQELYKYPDRSCSMAVDSGVKTPDGESTLSITTGERSDGNTTSGRQLIFACPNPFRPGQRVKVNFFIKSNAPCELDLLCSQRQAPYAWFGEGTKRVLAVDSSWQQVKMEFEVDRRWPDETVAVPRIMFGKVAPGTKLWIGPLTVEEVSGGIPIDLSGATNMGFADDTAGNGKGGWSDQGSDNDLRNFEFNQKTFCGIPFHLINPAKNHGRAVITFKSSQFPAGVQRAEVAVEPAAGSKYLYLLHSSCWCPADGITMGQIKVNFADGSQREFKVVSGTDIRDWWGPKAAGNALVAWEKNNRGLYLSRWTLPTVPVKSLTMTTEGSGVWIIVGATLSNREPKAVTADVAIVKANRDWRAITTDDLVVKAGSALDLSGLLEPGPAGKHGRLIVNPAGKLAFANQPDKPVRFRSFACMPWGIKKMGKPELARLAAALPRQGYNMIRLHGFDSWLTGQELAPWKPVDFKIPETIDTIKFMTERWDKLDFFIAELRKHGIYIYLDAMTSYLGYANDVNLFSYGAYHRLGAKTQLFVNPAYRNNWKAGVFKLLTHVNPYTGTTLRDDPQVAILLFCNEQDLRLDLNRNAGELLAPLWQRFLSDKYQTYEKLYQAWNGHCGTKALLPQGNFATVPTLDQTTASGNTQAGIDMTRFILEREREMTAWYQATIREIGYTGLTTQWDMIPRLIEIPVKTMLPVISLHQYHAHPSDFITPGSRLAQESALPSGGSSFKQLGPMRLLNRPGLVMEFALTYWNRYRHEQGLLFGAGAAFQDYEALNMHGGTVQLTADREMHPFNNTAVDPVNRASELVTAFAYLRGDVAMARHTVALALDEQYIFAGRALHAYNDELSKLWAVSKIGIYYRNDPKPPVKADLTLMPAESSLLKGGEGFVTTEESRQHYTALGRAVAEMRAKNLLSATNRTDTERGKFQSDTGEIFLDTKAATLSVITPRLEGTTVKTSQPIALNQVTVTACSVPASVTVVSLEHDAPIAQADRLLAVFATDALNSEMKFANAEHTALLQIGKLPVLMQTGRLTLDIRRTRPNLLPEVYALRINGERADKIPAKLTAAGIRLEIDTAKLSQPTPFFELQWSTPKK